LEQDIQEEAMKKVTRRILLAWWIDNVR
jgi:hypothetical protein